MKTNNKSSAIHTLAQRNVAALRTVVCISIALACSLAARAQTCPLSYGASTPDFI
jgi:hypothetical protein